MSTETTTEAVVTETVAAPEEAGSMIPEVAESSPTSTRVKVLHSASVEVGDAGAAWGAVQSDVRSLLDEMHRIRRENFRVLRGYDGPDCDWMIRDLYEIELGLREALPPE